MIQKIDKSFEEYKENNKIDNLIDVADLIVDIQKSGLLDNNKSYLNYRRRASSIIRETTKVGIIVLVDKITGYQQVKNIRFLNQIFRRFLKDEYAAWYRELPLGFYQRICELQGIKFDSPNNRDAIFIESCIEDIVFSRLDPEVLNELKKNPPKNNEYKHKKNKNSSHNHPVLETHIYSLLGLLKASRTWNEFYKLPQRAFLKKGSQFLLTSDLE